MLIGSAYAALSLWRDWHAVTAGGYSAVYVRDK